MYNRYIPNEYSYAPVRSASGKEHVRPEAKRERIGRQEPTLIGKQTYMDKNAGIAGILKALKLEQLDSGDLLLVMILLLLVLEGDNIELVITLGLLLLMGLGEDQKE